MIIRHVHFLSSSCSPFSFLACETKYASIINVNRHGIVEIGWGFYTFPSQATFPNLLKLMSAKIRIKMKMCLDV